MWLRRLINHTNAIDFRREPTLALVARIGACWLDPHLGSRWERHARAVAQYQGMAHYRSFWQRTLRRIASIPLLVAFIGQNAIRGASSLGEGEKEIVDGVKTGGDLREYELPPDLDQTGVKSWPPKASFLPWSEVGSIVSGFIAVGCWEPEVYYKCLVALAAQVGLFRRYRPRFVLMYKEYDFVCSMLAGQCHIYGAEAYNVMHGDKAYFARDAFFSVDRYYVWHQGYGDIARDMKAQPGQIITYTPHRMCLPKERLAPSSDILVLLPAYPIGSAAEGIWARTLIALASRWRVRIRPHPRNPFNPGLRAIAEREGVSLSDPMIEGAVEAIKSVRAVVGLQSTMLIEALCLGVGVCCIRDMRLDQMRSYHPFFRDDRIHITTMEELPGLIEARLT